MRTAAYSPGISAFFGWFRGLHLRSLLLRRHSLPLSMGLVQPLFCFRRREDLWLSAFSLSKHGNAPFLSTTSAAQNSKRRRRNPVPWRFVIGADRDRQRGIVGTVAVQCVCWSFHWVFRGHERVASVESQRGIRPGV